MIQPTINYLAVVVAAIATFVLGFLWHGPLFGKLWLQWSGFTQKQIDESKKKGMCKTMVVAFLTTLVMAYVLAHFVDYLEATTVTAGMTTGFWLWLGFVGTVQLNSVLWEQKPFKLYALNTGYQLVSLLMMGTILAVWV